MTMTDSRAVIWITGLSGSGKTTIATALVPRLRQSNLSALLLDGDAVRNVVDDPATGYDRSGRLANAYRIARLARMIAEQNTVVVVATMSLFHEIHDWNRRKLPGYFEVLLEVDLDILKRRDPKGLYAAAENQQACNVGGLDLPVEMPASPDLTIDNNDDLDDPCTLAERISDSAISALFSSRTR